MGKAAAIHIEPCAIAIGIQKHTAAGLIRSVGNCTSRLLTVGQCESCLAHNTAANNSAKIPICRDGFAIQAEFHILRRWGCGIM